ncbi:MAG: hypothetical protein LRY71_19680 [Bacillaceae bacterium]|nr:hypothetical protein [Bacillaceae bacterium]
MDEQVFQQLFNLLNEIESLMKKVNYHEGVSIVINLKFELIKDYYSRILD